MPASCLFFRRNLKSNSTVWLHKLLRDKVCTYFDDYLCHFYAIVMKRNSWFLKEMKDNLLHLNTRNKLLAEFQIIALHILIPYLFSCRPCCSADRGWRWKCKSTSKDNYRIKGDTVATMTSNLPSEQLTLLLNTRLSSLRNSMKATTTWPKALLMSKVSFYFS